MNILFIHNTVPEYRVPFMRILSKMDNIDFLITEPQLASNIYKVSSLDTTELSIINIRSKIELRIIRSLIIKGNYDIVILPPIDNFYQYICAKVAIYYAKQKKIKIVYWSEGWQLKELPFFKRIKKYIHKRMKQSIFSRCDICIAAGTQSLKYYKKLGVPSSKIKVAYDSSTSPTPNIRNIRVMHNIPNDAEIVLFLGRLIKRKGCGILINAFSTIAAAHKNAYLLIAGDGPEEKKYIRLAISKDIKSRVIFIGKVPPENRATYFKESNVFVLPSYAYRGTIEAWGLTVNEALEQGTPVVATDVVGAAYDLLDNQCGFMVRENNVTDLANAISKTLKMNRKHELSTICKSQYKKYSIEAMAEGFHNAFKDIV